MLKDVRLTYALAILIVIVTIGGLFRGYEFSNWMHYELDQSRDYRVIDAAVTHGPGELPLQGPKAAGSVLIDSDGDGIAEDKTTLRLGPLFYYIEYVSALIFGNTPQGSTMLILLFSIATIPLFYFFCKEFFPKNVSLGLTGLFSFSLYFIVYSRFGWNPNLIPFFMLSFAYSLLQATKEEYAKKKRGLWLVAASALFAFLSNMHFLAFVIAPVVAVLYLLWTRPKIALRYWIIAVGVFLLLNTPLIVNDVKTGGENSKAFIASLKGSSSEGNHSFFDKVQKNTILHGQYFWIVTTSDQRIAFPKDGFSACDFDCKDGFWRFVMSVIMILSGVAGWFMLFKREKCHKRKNFLVFVALWWCVTFVMYIPLAYDMAPRFFLVHAPLFLVLLGFIIHVGFICGRKYTVHLGYAIFALLFLAHIIFVGQYFTQLSRTNLDFNFRMPHKDYILNEKTRMHKAQIEEIVDDIEALHNANGYPIFLHGQAEHKRAFWERIDKRNIPRDHIPLDFGEIYKEGNYVIVIRTQSNQKRYLEKFRAAFDIPHGKYFGTLTLYVLTPKESVITAQSAGKIERLHSDPKFSDSAQVRYLWRQVFSGCTYSYATDKCE